MLTKSYKKRIALVVLTRAGLALALRLQRGLATDVSIYASHRAFPLYDVNPKGAQTSYPPGSAQGPHPTSTFPPTPTISHTFPLPSHLRHPKVGGNPSVGVGGAWDAGWGPCADPGCPSTPTSCGNHHTEPHTFPLPHHPRHPNAEQNPSVGVGGACDAGWGPCADPASPSTPTFCGNHHTEPHTFPLPHHPRHPNAEQNPSVGVGGACDAGWGPCADPASPSTPTSCGNHRADPREQAQSVAPTHHLIPPPESDPHPSITRFKTVAPLLSQLWTTYDQIVLFFALGAVVRLIAPLLHHKHVDPGIVAIDDAGQFAISVVSGHIGDANGLAQRCAEVLDAIPVVTTASDVHGTLAVDLLAHTQGWQVEDPSTITAVSAAIVNGEAVAILQTCGDLDWWKNTNPWPSNLLHVTNLQEVSATRFAALLVISDHLIEDLPQDIPTLVYRPPTLVLGIGCRRGISFDTLDTFVKATLTAHQLAFQSIALLATADIKADEAALQMLAQRYGWGFETHAVTALRTMTEVPNPSQRVQHLVGTPSVCEAAALLSSNGGTLIVAKQKGEGMTLAVARKAGQAIPEKGG